MINNLIPTLTMSMFFCTAVFSAHLLFEEERQEIVKKIEDCCKEKAIYQELINVDKLFSTEVTASDLDNFVNFFKSSELGINLKKLIKFVNLKSNCIDISFVSYRVTLTGQYFFYNPQLIEPLIIFLLVHFCAVKDSTISYFSVIKAQTPYLNILFKCLGAEPNEHIKMNLKELVIVGVEKGFNYELFTESIANNTSIERLSMSEIDPSDKEIHYAVAKIISKNITIKNYFLTTRMKTV